MSDEPEAKPKKKRKRAPEESLDSAMERVLKSAEEYRSVGGDGGNLELWSPPVGEAKR